MTHKKPRPTKAQAEQTVLNWLSLTETERQAAARRLLDQGLVTLGPKLELVPVEQTEQMSPQRWPRASQRTLRTVLGLASDLIDSNPVNPELEVHKTLEYDDFLEFVSSLETRFEINIPDSHLDALPEEITFRDFARLVQLYRTEKYGEQA